MINKQYHNHVQNSSFECHKSSETKYIRRLHDLALREEGGGEPILQLQICVAPYPSIM